MSNTTFSFTSSAPIFNTTSNTISFSIRTDILMILLFLFGSILINYLSTLFGKVQFVWEAFGKPNEPSSSEQPPLIPPEEDTKEKQKTPLEKLNQELLEADEIDPFDVLIRINKLMNSKPDISTYNNLLNICIIKKQFKKAEQFFSEMRDSSCPVILNAASYNIYFKSLVEMNIPPNFDFIQELLDEMEMKELKPDNITLNTVLDLAVISNDHSIIWQYFTDMKEKYNLNPDDYTYSIILKHIRECEFQFECHSFMDTIFEYLEKNIQNVDEVLLHNIIDTYGNQNDILKIQKLRNLLVKNKRLLSLSLYGKLIAIYAQNKLANDIFDVYQEILLNKVEPNEITYGCLLDAYLKCETLDKACDLYEHMLKLDKNVFNIRIYTSLIRIFAKKNDFSMAYGIYLQMKNFDSDKPNIISYNTMIDCCIKCKKFDIMERIYNDLLENTEIQPDAITFSTLIKGFCANYKCEKAIQLYEDLKKNKQIIKLDTIFFNSLLDGISVNPILSKNYAEKIISDMKSYNIEPNMKTYNILIKLFCKASDFGKAQQILHEMQKNGFNPTIIPYTNLIQLGFKIHQPDLAIKLYSELKINKIKTDQILYNTLIEGCLNIGFLENSCEIIGLLLSLPPI